ncbi:MAG: transcription elongation factor Spt5 [Promethearchaeota archaeon]
MAEETTNIYIVRTTIGQEKGIAHVISGRVSKRQVDLKAILVPEPLKGYIFIEARSPREVELAIAGIPHIKGIIPGKILIDEIEHILVPRPPTEDLEIGAIVEITGGPFKGERARVMRIDTSKDEITLELFEAPSPIPVKVHADFLRIVERRPTEELEEEEEEDLLKL